MFCPKCGTKNIDEAKFCGACGTPLSVNAGVSASQTVSAQPANKVGDKKKLPLIIGGAVAGVIAFVLIAIFVVIPAFNKNPFKGCQVGDVVEFGSYEQDGDTSNGKEPIEWRVLAVEGNRAYVVSQKALDVHAFNEDADDGNDWNSSDLKAWLEEDFASQAFTGNEVKKIDGAPTLLSVDEVNKYFKSDNDRICMPTLQAVNSGASTSNSDGACFWWLRSPGNDSFLAAYVYTVGRVFSSGNNVDSTSVAVRPALWVNL